jgi:hypothetical protein
LIAGSMITQPKRENAKIGRRDTRVPAHESNEPVVPHLYVDARARLHHDFGQIRCYPRRED